MEGKQEGAPILSCSSWEKQKMGENILSSVGDEVFSILFEAIVTGIIKIDFPLLSLLFTQTECFFTSELYCVAAAGLLTQNRLIEYN